MIYHYFLSANSSQGYVDWTARCARQLAHVVHTTGYPGRVLRALEGAAITLAKEQGTRLDIIHRPLDGGVAGLITPENGAAVFDTPVWLDRRYHVTNLMEDGTRDRMQRQLLEVYRLYAAAKQIHDEWETVYISETDYGKLDACAHAFCGLLVGEAPAAEQPGKRTDAFFGAGTPDGPVDYIACLTADIKKRYFLKGRPGTGKSTFLKKAADAAQRAGYDVEVYHCSFDPEIGRAHV